MKLDRRSLLLGAASFGISGVAAAEPILTDDGLYKEPWFLETFLELSDDLETTAKAGKRFVISWELKGALLQGNPLRQFRAIAHFRLRERNHLQTNHRSHVGHAHFALLARAQARDLARQKLEWRKPHSIFGRRRSFLRPARIARVATSGDFSRDMYDRLTFAKKRDCAKLTKWVSLQ